MKFCKDCKHYGNKTTSCKRLISTNRNPLTGHIDPVYLLHASLERSNYEGIQFPVIANKMRRVDSNSNNLKWFNRIFMWVFRIEQGEDWQSCGKDAIFFEDIDPIPTPLPFKPPSSES